MISFSLEYGSHFPAYSNNLIILDCTLKIIKIRYRISGVCYVPLKDIGDFLCLFYFLKHVVKLIFCFTCGGKHLG